MRNRRKAAGMVFVLIGLMWMILSFSRATNRNTYLALGVVFLILGIGLSECFKIALESEIAC